MNAGLMLGAAVALLTSQSKLDDAIGGKSVHAYYEPVYDAKQRLYLYSGGD